MGIITGLYLIFWTVLVHYFQNTSFTHGMESSQFKPIATQMLTQMGFQFSAMLIALLSIMLGAGAIASELETGLIHGILARPVRRYEYVLGKFFGLAALIAIFTTVLYTFILAIGALFSLSSILNLSLEQILSGWFFYLLSPIAVLCLTLFGSVSMKVVPNGILMIFIYILGSVGGMVETIGSFINNPAVSSAGIFISLISPFETIYSTMERVLLEQSGLQSAAMGGAMSGSTTPASIWMWFYITLYMFTFLLGAIHKFSKKDII